MICCNFVQLSGVAFSGRMACPATKPVLSPSALSALQNQALQWCVARQLRQELRGSSAGSSSSSSRQEGKAVL